MSTLAYALTDSRTMLRRTLRRMVRYPSLTMFVIGIPLVLMLLFVYVFGGTLGAGLSGVSGGRQAYLNYLVPGILTITVAGVAQGTAISIAMDMAAGIIARFRTMAISRSSVLAGHVLGALIQNLIGVGVILAVAVLLGFAQYQPFTPVTETLRGLLTGTPIGHHGIVAVAWCLAITLGSYVWAIRLFNRFPRKARWLNTGVA